MKSRIITGAVLSLAAAGFIYFGNIPFAVAALLCICFALAEEYKALRHAGYHPVAEPTWMALAASIPLAVIFGHTVVVPILMAASLITIGIVIFRTEQAPETAPDSPEGPSHPPRTMLENAMMSLLPLYSIVLPGLAIVSLSQITPLSVQRVMLLMLIAVPVLGDTMAYFVGSAVGGPKFCPAVSPNKTVAGAVAGLGGSVLAAVLIRLVAGWICAPTTVLPDWILCLAIGFLGGLGSQLGDLFASMVKRHCGIKDFSEIFPGHGGMLDRMDSILFMSLVLYCCRLLFFP